MGKKDEKLRTIENAVRAIEKQFGAGAIMQLGDTPKGELAAISLGTLGIDLALGIGGLPRGRIVEVFGHESSGKTTLALHAIAEAQRSGGLCAFVDAEHALDPVYAQALGVDLDRLWVSQPDSGEQALEICEMLARSGGVDLIVVDSVAALVPRAEIDGDMGDAHMGLQARLMSQALRKLTSVAAKTESTILFINQVRQKIGVVFGNPEVTTGGNALKFYASMRLEVRRIGAIKKADVVVGNRARIKVVKNKLAPPFRDVEVDIRFGKGIDRLANLLELGVEHDIVQRTGAWYSYQDEKLGQGRDKAIETLGERHDLSLKLHEAIYRSIWPENTDLEAAKAA
jgi:recombination protein RecA